MALGNTLIGYGEPQTRAVVNIAEYEDGTYFNVTYNGTEYTCGESFTVNIGDSIVINLTATGNRVTNKINVGGTDVVSKTNAVATYTLEVTSSIDITYTMTTSSGLLSTTTHTATVTDSTIVTGFERKITKGVALIGYGEPQTRAVVTITGSGRASGTYGDQTNVVINGTTYNSEATVEVAVGTEISILVKGGVTFNGQLTVDGTTVVTTTSSTTYTYTVEKDITINLVVKSSTSGTTTYYYSRPTITTDSGGAKVAYEITRGMTLIDGVAYEIGDGPIPVTFYGVGNSSSCYCEIDDVKYYQTTSGVEVNSGDVIHLYALQNGSYVGSITINGTSVGTGGTKSYNWTVPDGVSEITIGFSRQYGNAITVTTA